MSGDFLYHCSHCFFTWPLPDSTAYQLARWMASDSPPASPALGLQASISVPEFLNGGLKSKRFPGQCVSLALCCHFRAFTSARLQTSHSPTQQEAGSRQCPLPRGEARAWSSRKRPEPGFVQAMSPLSRLRLCGKDWKTPTRVFPHTGRL